MSSFHPFFENNVYVIDEKVRAFKMTNAYRVYSQSGEEIGAIQEVMPWYRVLLRLFVSRSSLPFTLNILADDGAVLAQIRRGFTFAFSKITVLDGTGTELARINQKFTWIKPKFALMSPAGEQIGMIQGDWKGWNFEIFGRGDQVIGVIDKKWNGVLKEAFTTADKYIVNINPSVSADAERIAIVAAAITIDMVLKEGQ
ncbi:MAG: phospholipid scramblase family protein [Coriobacteriia bacterium]|nr:phospholipid scramblase family protein [Coriobacteriia bacterium]